MNDIVDPVTTLSFACSTPTGGILPGRKCSGYIRIRMRLMMTNLFLKRLLTLILVRHYYGYWHDYSSIISCNGYSSELLLLFVSLKMRTQRTTLLHSAYNTTDIASGETDAWKSVNTSVVKATGTCLVKIETTTLYSTV